MGAGQGCGPAATAGQLAALAVVVGLSVASCTDGEIRGAERVPASAPASVESPSNAAPSGPLSAARSGDWQRLPGPAGRGPGPGFQVLAPVLAGDKVVVVAGVDYDQATVKAIVVDPDSRRWSRAAPSGMWWRSGYTAVAAGDQVIVWGGCCGVAGRGSRAAGAIYDVTQDRWLPLGRGPLGDRGGHTAVWTGEEMLVWGGGRGSGGLRADGAAYDPRSESWRLIPSAPLAPRYQHVAVWTGEEMIVWGGSRPLRPLRGFRERPLYDGAAYDPRSDTWRRLPPTRVLAPLPAVLDILDESEELDLNAVWTGEVMLIWGPNGGASYDPDSDQWERITTPPSDFGVTFDASTAVWTGDEMIVWGGLLPGSDRLVATGAAYDPRHKRWRQLPPAPISGRYQHAAVWTGEGMLVWGGCCHRAYLADGAIYTP
jgi:Kelch motif